MSVKVNESSGQTARIDGGKPVGCILTIERDIIPISTALPRRNPAWEFTDTQGHYHAYDADGDLPTLTRHVEDKPCDGSCGNTCDGSPCEGYTVTTWTCMACDEQVEPGLLHGVHAESIPGRYTWSLLIDGEAPKGKTVSIVVDVEGGKWRYFGFAIPDAVEQIGEGSGYVRTTLREASPIGKRAA